MDGNRAMPDVDGGGRPDAEVGGDQYLAPSVPVESTPGRQSTGFPGPTAGYQAGTMATGYSAPAPAPAPASGGYPVTTTPTGYSAPSPAPAIPAVQPAYPATPPGYTAAPLAAPMPPRSAPKSPAPAQPVVGFPGLGSAQADTLKENLPVLAKIEELVTQLTLRYQRLLDVTTPHSQYRWAGFAVLLLLFLARILYLHEFYIVCYVLFIFILNQLILFLQPKDYANLMESNTEEPSLPVQKQEEFRPFIRRLPEFKFWYTLVRATLFAIIATFIPVFNIPVCWQILVTYFVMLFVVTMRRQIMDMKKFKYVPWDIGRKKKYRSSVSVTSPKASDKS